METHSSILAYEIQWTEESGGLQSMGLQKSQIRTSTLLHPPKKVTAFEGDCHNYFPVTKWMVVEPE